MIREGESPGFLVQASDPNGTIPVLSVQPLPPGASFTNSGSGEGIFLWTPGVGQYGVYPVRFEATDGELSDWKIVKIYVGHVGEPLCGGVPCSLTDWGVEIKELLADANANAVTVRWDTADGILYELYGSADPFSGTGRWEKVGGTVVGTGSRYGVAEVGLSSNVMRRYYKVVLAGEAPDTQHGVVCSETGGERDNSAMGTAGEIGWAV